MAPPPAPRSRWLRSFRCEDGGDGGAPAGITKGGITGAGAAGEGSCTIDTPL